MEIYKSKQKNLYKGKNIKKSRNKKLLLFCFKIISYNYFFM